MSLRFLLNFLFILCLLLSNCLRSQSLTDSVIQISGVYPHLAVFNPGDGIDCRGNGNECGIGAVVPWNGKLWMITYSPHCPHGSSDKLYSISDKLELTTHPESVGGTPANRMIHRESNQLLIGPYLIDQQNNIRVIHPEKMPGRLTATVRHLTDPANLVYYYDMEGALYEADVNSLAVNRLFEKPVPGWHGKGAYSGQGRLVIANNGEHQVFDIDPALLQAGGAPQSDEDNGALAEWDGETWNIVTRRQFTDITGPGGIYGANNPEEPIWSIGWDQRSVMLMVLDNGEWFRYRLPKSTHTYDHWGGWYTEWPRIREVTNGQWLMDMHGMFYNFPPTFSSKNTAGILPIANHLRYVPDFCAWNDQLVLATDETSILQNPYAGRSQSILWFGQIEDLKNWGASNGWGGVWMNETVQANTASDAFLISGFNRKLLHLVHNQSQAVTFTLEVDREGNNQWQELTTVEVDESQYAYYIIPNDTRAEWIRLKTNQNCIASAYFHFNQKRDGETLNLGFQTLASPSQIASANVIRPAGHNTNLQVLNKATDTYWEVNEKMQFIQPAENRTAEVNSILELKQEFRVDAASVIVEDEHGTFRLPRTDKRYDQPFAGGWPRGIREVESERYMANFHGTFYEIPREAGLQSIRPIATHEKQIIDFCTWRGLLVLSGTQPDAVPNGHYFASPDNETSLWFGAIDDTWQLGKPRGTGGPWKDTAVEANTPSLPYLMTGYDQKTLTLTADQPTNITVEIDFDHTGWYTYQTFTLEAGQTTTHEFPEGFSAHWLRVISDHDCVATAWLEYQ
ncbi:MAG: hypothetical protein ACFB15_13535 [Cyclobacteriaceae bacterium]